MATPAETHLTDAERYILALIGSFGDDGLQASKSEIAGLCSMSSTTSDRCCRRLKDNGMLTVEASYGPDGGRLANTYRITERGELALSLIGASLPRSVKRRANALRKAHSADGGEPCMGPQAKPDAQEGRSFAHMCDSDARFLRLIGSGIGGGITDTMQAIADAMGVCRRTILRSKRRLEEQGLIECSIGFAADGGQTANTYRITPAGSEALRIYRAEQIREQAGRNARPALYELSMQDGKPRKLRVHRLPVCRTDTGEVFKSARAAGKMLSEAHGGSVEKNGKMVISCCRHAIPSWQGIAWKFAFDDEEEADGQDRKHAG